MLGWFSDASVLASRSKTRQAFRICRKRVRQHLDRHLATNCRVGAPIHLPHPAHTDLARDFVDAETMYQESSQIGWKYSG